MLVCSLHHPEVLRGSCDPHPGCALRTLHGVWQDGEYLRGEGGQDDQDNQGLLGQPGQLGQPGIIGTARDDHRDMIQGLCP